MKKTNALLLISFCLSLLAILCATAQENRQEAALSDGFFAISAHEQPALDSSSKAAESAQTPAATVNLPFVSEIPAAYLEACSQAGTVERIEYATYAYTRDGTPGKAGINEAYVYLPYGYDPDGAYNILYLMHGGNENAGYWFSRGDYPPDGPTSATVHMLDHLIASQRCEPLIVVTPCMDAGNRYGFNDAGTFRYEFKQDLVPAVESQYATFARGDTSTNSLIASRSHRAYAGLSLGSAAGFSSILLDCLDYVGYIGNFSGCYANIYATAAAINTTYSAYPILYWYNGNGSYDSSRDNHLRAYRQMLKLCADRLTEGTDAASGHNCCFFEKSGKAHRYDSWIADLYNVLQVFFRYEPLA